MKKQTIQELKTQLVFAESRAASSDWQERVQGRADVKRLKARIARRERDQVYRDCGLVKVRGALGGTYYE